MAPVSALKRPLFAMAALVTAFLMVAGSSAALPSTAPPSGMPSAPSAAVPNPADEQRVVTAAAKAATQIRLVQEAAEAQRKAAAAAQAAAAKAAAAQAAAQAAAAQAAQQAAAQAAAQQAAARQAGTQAQAASAPAPKPAAPAPAAPPTAYIPVVGAGGQAAVNACQGPVRFTPVTVSISIAEHDYCGGWSLMSWIQPGTIVTVQGYGTFTAFQRMVVSQGASEYVVGNFAGGYPPIFLQTCIPGTSEMLLIGLH